ncbi:hypothetical protein NAEGRDRAFT_80773 [Naegleria gruberi]|uniref:Serine/threonine-protein phosphatase n=1 Tax=Naegleria gruberi TaxID=5762 RepID=D2VPM4_NAEGR|nr:uncharacterized protein NAEGRDRAFT_80773 [Naegleria gruberi]EFC41233.1 hypothetical protein NAEGRDRAFT_80773 [Naegleria gruberi]|eukprot:XP_002673977.1 hypothetical protein NAEGRDRAFT_80773 [Naegleria gruberi strain NEG-M]
MSSVVDVNRCIEKLEAGRLLSEFEVKFICEKVKEILIDEANVQRVKSPVSVVGNIHGQFLDLKEMFRVGGKIPDTNYLFLGDYVNRGTQSVETISLLTCYKLRYPERITLLRGNHESRPITQVYGFYQECILKYGNANVWKYFTDMFDYLTICALIDDSIFCVHGGLSPSIATLDQIRVLERFKDVPSEGPISDLLWSDPSQDDEDKRDGNVGDFKLNLRGIGFVYSKKFANEFCATNKISHIVRSHQLCMDGYQVLWDDKLSTIWSAPNYCNRCGNVAAILEVNRNLDKFYNTFYAAPRKTLKKQRLDAIKDESHFMNSNVTNVGQNVKALQQINVDYF